FSGPVTGTDNPLDWRVTDARGGLIAVTGVSGSGNSPTLQTISAVPKGSSLAYQPAPASTPYADDASNSVTGFPVKLETPPIVSVTTPVGTIYTNGSSSTISGTTDAGSSVALFRDTNADGAPDGDALANTTAGSDGSFSVVAPLLSNTANHLLPPATRSDMTGPYASAQPVV